MSVTPVVVCQLKLDSSGHMRQAIIDVRSLRNRPDSLRAMLADCIQRNTTDTIEPDFPGDARFTQEKNGRIKLFYRDPLSSDATDKLVRFLEGLGRGYDFIAAFERRTTLRPPQPEEVHDVLSEQMRVYAA